MISRLLFVCFWQNPSEFVLFESVCIFSEMLSIIIIALLVNLLIETTGKRLQMFIFIEYFVYVKL